MNEPASPAAPAYCRVAIDSPVAALDRAFDYSIPQRMRGNVAVGSVVRVVLHGRRVRAFVTELMDEPAVEKTRSLSALVSPKPIFDEPGIELARWTARRYVCPLGVVLHDAVPGRFSTPEGTDARSSPEGRVPRPSIPPGLLDVVSHGGEACLVPTDARAEKAAIASVVDAVGRQGKRSLVICPRLEIAESLASALPGAAILHGGERPSERSRVWGLARDGHVDVVVGSRSSLFVPMSRVGLICVASAHDRSLKSERAPRLHASEVARRRAGVAGAAFLVSSPCPPVEMAASMRTIPFGDRSNRARPELARPRKGPVTERLIELSRWAVAHGGDVLVFAGRIGDALRLRCSDCGWVPSCSECGTGLSLGRGEGERRLSCRVCGRQQRVPDTCTSCGGELSERGWGHERVARALEAADVGAPVVRMVRGTKVQDLPRPVVVVGTLAAAHEMTDAKAVCVADLDQLLSRPDFRASEHALQTLYELASSLAPGGRFLLQTREPEHHVVQAFARGSFKYFLDRELPFREEVRYPPYGAVVRVELEEDAVEDLRRLVRDADATVVGPVRRRGRASVLVRAGDLEPLLGPLRDFVRSRPTSRVDVDPVDIT